MVDLQRGTGQTTDRAIVYRDVDLPAGTRITLQFTGQNIVEARYDSNNDGVAETLLTATVDVTGTQANDRIAPTITATVSPVANGQVQVAFAAQDSSGIQSLYYSLDGSTFEPYTTALTVNPTTVKSIYAYADDTVGNRSDLFRQVLNQASVSQQPVRPVLECVIVNPAGGYTAFFGYRNDNTIAITIPVGANNRFSPNPQARGQTTTFLPGRQQSIFAVDWPNGNLVWTLKGPDGGTRTSTASPNSQRCTQP